MSKKRNQHCLDPISPALLGRIDVAIGLSGTGSERLYSDVAGEWLDEDFDWGSVSEAFVRMEDSFVTELEEYGKEKHGRSMVHARVLR